MAIFCLAADLADLQRRLGQIQIGQTRDKKAVTAKDLSAAGSMAALLKDALAPNLVQTLENNPAFIHGGPFANIAHGCNSVIATKAALKLADYVITEAGFGADLGAEKFFDIKCRKAGLEARLRRDRRHHPRAQDAWRRGQGRPQEGERRRRWRRASPISSVTSRICSKYDVPVVVSINRFSSDTEAEIALLKRLCATIGVECVMADHWAQGGAGAVELAETVVRTIDEKPSDFQPLYPDDMSLWDKTRTIAQEIYGAEDITADKSVTRPLRRAGEGRLRQVPDLRRQDAIQLHHQPRRQGRALGAHHSDPRGQAFGRRRVRGGDLRRHHDHAGPAQGAGRQQYRACGRRAYRRSILGAKGVAR